MTLDPTIPTKMLLFMNGCLFCYQKERIKRGTPYTSVMLVSLIMPCLFEARFSATIARKSSFRVEINAQQEMRVAVSNQIPQVSPDSPVMQCPNDIHIPVVTGYPIHIPLAGIY